MKYKKGDRVVNKYTLETGTIAGIYVNPDNGLPIYTEFGGYYEVIYDNDIRYDYIDIIDGYKYSKEVGDYLEFIWPAEKNL